MVVMLLTFILIIISIPSPPHSFIPALLYWYRLTRVVSEKGPLNWCVFVSAFERTLNQHLSYRFVC